MAPNFRGEFDTGREQRRYHTPASVQTEPNSGFNNGQPALTAGTEVSMAQRQAGNGPRGACKENIKPGPTHQNEKVIGNQGRMVFPPQTSFWDDLEELKPEVKEKLLRIRQNVMLRK